MQVFGLEGRYATALYSAATKQKCLDAVEKDLVNFQKSLKSDTKLRDYILNPVINRTEKAQALKAVGEKIKFNPQSTNLLQVLAENGRLKNYDGVVNAFKTIMAAHRGEASTHILVALQRLIVNCLGEL